MITAAVATIRRLIMYTDVGKRIMKNRDDRKKRRKDRDAEDRKKNRDGRQKNRDGRQDGRKGKRDNRQTDRDADQKARQGDRDNRQKSRQDGDRGREDTKLDGRKDKKDIGKDDKKKDKDKLGKDDKKKDKDKKNDKTKTDKDKTKNKDKKKKKKKDKDDRDDDRDDRDDDDRDRDRDKDRLDGRDDDDKDDDNPAVVDNPGTGVNTNAYGEGEDADGDGTPEEDRDGNIGRDWGRDDDEDDDDNFGHDWGRNDDDDDDDENFGHDWGRNDDSKDDDRDIVEHKGAVGGIVVGGVMLVRQAFQRAPGVIASGFRAVGHFFLKMGQSFISAIGSFASGLATTVAGAVTGIASAVGASVMAVIIAGVVGFGAIGLAGLGLMVSLSELTSAITDEKSEDPCEVNVADIAGGGPPAAPNAMQLQNAQKIYSVFSTWGMSDVHVAGVLGNFSIESGIDPTAVETIYTEDYHIGPEKAYAISVGFDIDQMDPDYGSTYPNIVHCGIGLGQWTDTADGAQNNTKLLQYAESIGQPWYMLETQLSFMMTPPEQGGDPNYVALVEYKNTPLSTPEEASDWFQKHWEKNPTMHTEERRASSAQWYVTMQNWTADTDYANSIIDQAGSAQGGATDDATNAANVGCGAYSSENTSLASSAVAIAWPSVDQAMGNNGTETYQAVKDAIFPGDPYYMSCDRTVATAVRWAGADDDFPAGDVDKQLSYMASSPNWTEVTSSWDGNPDNLAPGDILVQRDGEHIVMYVGNEAVQVKYPEITDPAYCVVGGSYGDYSPAVQPWYSGSEITDLNNYRVFRNAKMETNSKYTDVLSDENGDNVDE